MKIVKTLPAPILKIGDLVRRKGFFELQHFAAEFGVDGVGIIINFPDNMGDVVDVMVSGKKVRYWIAGLEIVPQVLEHDIETLAMSLSDFIE